MLARDRCLKVRAHGTRASRGLQSDLLVRAAELLCIEAAFELNVRVLELLECTLLPRFKVYEVNCNGARILALNLDARRRSRVTLRD